MKIEVLSQKIITENPHSRHNYFAWPSVARLQNGKLAMVCSGYRFAHACPFGKAVISYSEDEGNSWTRPAPVIDTPLDDRDAGITPFGDSSVMVTSFNNRVETQRRWNPYGVNGDRYHCNALESHYIHTYLDLLDIPGDEEQYLGSNYVISHDGGVTFGEIGHLPVTCPHGPTALPDGSLLYVGRCFDDKDTKDGRGGAIRVYKVYGDGHYEFLSAIDNVGPDLESYEPHAVILPDGKILVHIRVQTIKPDLPRVFTIYQSESTDGGKSFSAPRALLPQLGGSPPHLLLLRDGTLVSTYGYREEPYGIRSMFSQDGGRTWDTDHILYTNTIIHDMGYPCSVELSDGSILTVYYAHATDEGPAVIMQTIWRRT